ncbi:uncharacterized protein LOC123685870 [Harmonia axyridis]|uniref:uncharacterized protein LOC123685870 n=1 Tax=Harmonia axyridis TaxID=115357 RepID=UPI001E277F5E|nr:uncharacterized protein LOC123685870 [Harmonia axyridis]
MLPTASTTSTANTSCLSQIPFRYPLGIMTTTLDDFSGKDVTRYFEKFELRSQLDGWSEHETLTLLKFKLVGDAYNFFKSDIALNSLSYAELKARFLQKFSSVRLPWKNQWNLNNCFQRQDEDVSSFCTRLRIIGAELLSEDLSGATKDEESGIRKKNRDLILNQFKIGLRKEVMREVGIFLLREENLDLEKAEELVRLQETTHEMLQGRLSTRNISEIKFGVICQFCREVGHSAKECRSTWANWRNIQQNVKKGCYSCGQQGHFARECRTYRRSVRINSEGCYSCNQIGHWSRECPTKNWRETQSRNNSHYRPCSVSNEFKIGNIRKVYLSENKSEGLAEKKMTDIQEDESRIEKKNIQSVEKQMKSHINNNIFPKVNKVRELEVETQYKDINNSNMIEERVSGIKRENIRDNEEHGLTVRKMMKCENLRDLDGRRDDSVITAKEIRKTDITLASGVVIPVRSKELIPAKLKNNTERKNLVGETMKLETRPIHEIANQNIQAEKSARVTRVNTKSVDPQFKLADLVYLKEMSAKRGLSRKLLKNWAGPYRVTEIIGPVTCRVRKCGGRDEQIVHVNRLKPYTALGDEMGEILEKRVRSGYTVLDTDSDEEQEELGKFPPFLIPTWENQDEDQGESEEESVEEVEIPVRRSNRLRRPPDRWGYY